MRFAASAWKGCGRDLQSQKIEQDKHQIYRQRSVLFSPVRQAPTKSSPEHTLWETQVSQIEFLTTCTRHWSLLACGFGHRRHGGRVRSSGNAVPEFWTLILKRVRVRVFDNFSGANFGYKQQVVISLQNSTLIERRCRQSELHTA